ncbi:MBL fold metallo-hydrolase [bacterium]|nr:MBL fold metallo-hydrolase [bacterium]
MKITILYDNTTYQKNLEADWGFACCIEIENETPILFDTGANGDILLSNMAALKINPQSIERVFISHAHFDHTGGLSAFLNINSGVTIYCPNSFRGVRRANEVIYVLDFIKLNENLYSTGELNGIEQSLVIETEKGLVLMIGCAHPGMKTIFQSVPHLGSIHAVIGGFHGFQEYDLLQNVDLICPTHCTQNQETIRSLYPRKTIQGGVGRIIHL